MGTVEFRLLGSVDARVDGRSVPLGTAKQRCLLALLLLDLNTLVHVDRLTDLLWGEQPPPEARASLQVYVSRLRRALADHPDVTLVTNGPCYLVHAHPEQIDLYRFRRLVAEAADHGTDAQAIHLYRQALSLWRGRALDDVAPPHLRQTVCANLNDEHLAAWEALIDVELRRGNHATLLLRELADLADRHPLRERLAGQLMTALYRNGQRADALAHYQTVRVKLSTDLGIDPSPHLSNLHQRMLRDDPDLFDTTAAPPVESPEEVTPGGAQPLDAVDPAPVTPAQLPADLITFTGRRADLAQLPEPDELPGAMVSCAIDGMAGVGKTALAVHWAHRVSGRFPDGQFFLDLHGHTRGVEPVDPGAALDRMLRDLGLPGERVPHDLDERAALYRSVLAGRRVLIVLDNASSASQVLPLLPGTPGCLVIVTSRRRLFGLDPAYQLSLDVLAPDEAVALFTRIAGPHAEAGGATVSELVGLVGYLPLAIRIAAARLRARPAWTPAHLAERLRDEHRRLTELDDGQAGVAATFALSTQTLPAAERRLFRLLGLHPGPDIDEYAAAALTGGGAADTGPLLERLVDENLLLSRRPDRYRLHDLVRAHAAARAEAEEGEQDRQAALLRLFAHYTGTASAAALLLYPYDFGSQPGDTQTAVRFADQAHAADWLDAELPNLLATAAYAVRHGWPGHASRLSRALWRHLAERSHFGAALTLHGYALRSAVLASDRLGEARALVDLGTVHGRQGHYEQAVDHLQRALLLYREAGDAAGEVRTLGGLGVAHERMGRYRQAADFLRQALALYRASENRSGEASVLLNLGIVCGRLGRYDEALEHFQRALALNREVGNRGSEARALANAGVAYARLGRYDEALEHHRQSLDLFRQLGNEDQQADSLTEIGNVLRQRGEYDRALDHHRRALALFREVGNDSGESEVLNDLGLTLRAAGRPADALDSHRRSLRLAEQNQDRYEQARALDGIAGACWDLNEADRAREHWRRALEIFAELGTPEAGEVRARLAIR